MQEGSGMLRFGEGRAVRTDRKLWNDAVMPLHPLLLVRRECHVPEKNGMSRSPRVCVVFVHLFVVIVHLSYFRTPVYVTRLSVTTSKRCRC